MKFGSVRFGKLYNEAGSLHCFRYKDKVMSLSGVIRKKEREELFSDSVGFPFTVRYGFHFRHWLGRIKSEPEVSRHRLKAFMPDY